MNLLRWVPTLVLLVACNVMCEEADPREKLDGAIAESIRLLEAKDYVTFLNKFAPPDKLKANLGNGSIEDLAKVFGARKAVRALKVLKEIKEKKPTMSDDGMTAKYALEEAVDDNKEVVFEKVGKFWYIRN